MATKAEFIDTLRHTLNGSMDSAQVEDNVRFYDSYIMSEITKGRSEGEVLAQLGDPRILSRTLIDAAERAGSGVTQDGSYRSGPDLGRGGETRGTGRSQTIYEDTADQTAVKAARIPGWLIALIVIVVLVGIISFVGSLIWAVLPFLLPILLVIWVVRIVRKS